MKTERDEQIAKHENTKRRFNVKNDHNGVKSSQENISIRKRKISSQSSRKVKDILGEMAVEESNAMKIRVKPKIKKSTTGSLAGQSFVNITVSEPTLCL